eukprot:19482-Eustigmatos_ZCMA.PRE.1
MAAEGQHPGTWQFSGPNRHTRTGVPKAPEWPSGEPLSACRSVDTCMNRRLYAVPRVDRVSG